MPAVHCRFCQHANPGDAKFCNACGIALERVSCPHCGAGNDLGAELCGICGGPMPASAANAAVLAATGADIDETPGSGDVGAEPTAYTLYADGSGNLRIGYRFGHPTVHAFPGGALAAAPSAVPQSAVAHEMLLAAVPGADGLPPRARHPEPPRPVRAADGLQRRQRAAGMIGMAILAALVVSGYGAYRHQRPELSLLHGIPTGAAGSGTAAEAQSAPTAHAGAEPIPAALATSADALNDVRAALAVAPPAAPPATVQGRSDVKLDALPPRAFVAKRAEDRSRSPEAAAAVVAATTRPRPDASGTPPSSLGPCTQAVAALGLCTLEGAPRRP